MGLTARAILKRGTTIEQISEALKELYSWTNPVPSPSDPETAMILMGESGEAEASRTLYINTLSEEIMEEAYGIDGILCHFNALGERTVEILNHLCKTFGGYISTTDAGGWIKFKLINEAKFNGTAETPPNWKIDFRKKIFNKFGAHTSNIMTFCEEYAKLEAENQKPQ